MKCGICKRDTWTPRYRIVGITYSYFGQMIPSVNWKERPIRDRTDLRLHKQQDHADHPSVAKKVR